MKSLIVISLFLIFGCTTEVEYIPIPQRPIPTALMSEKENAMLVLTNQSRVALRLPKYRTSLSLYHVAKARVYNIEESDSLSHNGWYSGYQQSGAIYYGESISYNFISAQSNIEGFRSSNDHWQMLISPIYEYIAIACEDNYTVVLVARWRNYNGKRALEIVEVRTGNVSTLTIH